ncbi:MAG: ATP-binding cassette domain-containing protein [Bacilli bacterium]
MLKISNLTKNYKVGKRKYFTALKDVNFEINDENMIAVIGESGSGKSTLMNLISTIDIPSNGYVEYKSQKITFLKDRKRTLHRKENVGFIFQSFNLITDISVLENVAIVMEIAGYPKAKRYKRAEELLVLVGLSDHLHKRPGYLSGGQKQRVAIARALANNPDLILADEPTGALDKKTSQEIMKLLSTIAASGKKVIIVTHDMKVASYCERIITMKDGLIIEDKKNQFEELNKIELPKPLKKTKRGLGFSGVFKLSSSAFVKRIRRNILLSIGTAIAISSLFIINIAKTSLTSYFEDLYKFYGNENVAKVMVINLYENFAADMSGKKSNSSKEIFSKYSEIDKIVSVPNYNISNNEFKLSDGTSVDNNTIYPDGIRFFGTKDLLAGSAPDQKNEIAITEDIAKLEGHTNKNAIGKKLSITMTDFLTAKTTQTEFKISGVVKNDGPRNNLNTIYLNDEFSASYGTTDDSAEFLSNYIIEVEEGKIKSFLEKLNKSNSKNLSSGYVISPFRDVQMVSMIELMINGTLQLFSVILGVSVFVAAIMIMVMSYVSILERMKEVGVLRAIGAQKRDIVKMFMIESTAIGLFSGIFASIIGIGLGAVLINVANNMFDFTMLGAEMTLHVRMLSVLIVILGSIILSIVSSLISIFKGLSVAPVDALKMK